MDQEYPYRSSRATTSYVNKELADALIDVVQVTRNGSSRPVSANNSQLGLAVAAADNRSRRSPSPRMPGSFEPAMSLSPPKDPFVDNLDMSEPSRRADKDGAKRPSSSRNKSSSSRGDKDRSASGSKEANRRPSRHADVIDTWDPSGGHALWHHSGPYDAAAPSRNLNQPDIHAPMRAFEREEAAKAAANTVGDKEPLPRTVPQVVAPALPPKDNVGARRTSAAARNVPRRTSGGLSGQYSTSYPTSGGHFPNQDVLPEDETPTSPQYQRRQKEEKQRALKAAWGIDEPEPFEDFGSSPRDESYINLGDNFSSPNDEAGTRGSFFGRSSRGRTEETSPGPDDQTFGAKSTRPGGGVKRTKSLMQKIKSMRGDRSRSPHKYSPSTEYPPMPSLAHGAPAQGQATNSGMGDHRRPSLPARPERSAARLGPTCISAPSTVPASGAVSNVGSGAVSKAGSTTDSSHGHSASLPSQMTEEIIENGNGSGNGQSLGSRLEPYTYSSGGMRRPSKNLPQPPVGPVMPDFDDLVIGRGSSPAKLEDAAPVKRKTSVVKKLTGRVSR
ncbi:hypothetical protein CspeluHIS016_0603200 [Cutaneotrichosporon spelunceum]|uniref:Pal1-domain-containing protein n=1 Tax=Cutaneotrichosporon spelunceum TaxID=1672016 RepID=A0AAD3TY27_9TREE|nr:hypothetical protein CspeluHIS016_0603200 [Cutaneotrichosporon spelunceum]